MRTFAWHVDDQIDVRIMAHAKLIAQTNAPMSFAIKRREMKQIERLRKPRAVGYVEGSLGVWGKKGAQVQRQ